MYRQRGGIELILLAIIVAASFIVAGGVLTFKKTPSTYTPVNLDTNVNHASEKNLQLINLGPKTPSPAPSASINPNATPTPTPIPTGWGLPISIIPPTPENSCNIDSGIVIPLLANGNPACTCIHDNGNQGAIVKCVGGQCVKSWANNAFGPCDQNYINNKQCQQPIAGFDPQTGTYRDGIYCVAKPVIYLYPTKKTLVDVSVETSGKIVISDPLYPANGWKNVLAYPNGDLFYNGKKYSELFYESDVTNIAKPTNGLYILKSNLNSELPKIITQLGLKGGEKQEFLDYWLKKLSTLDSKYIIFSVLDDKEKERVDKVNISPKPDTFIAFIAYFKGVNTITPIEPLILPKNPPARIGFTAVEWGGTIDNF